MNYTFQILQPHHLQRTVVLQAVLYQSLPAPHRQLLWEGVVQSPVALSQPLREDQNKGLTLAHIVIRILPTWEISSDISKCIMESTDHTNAVCV